MDQWVNLHNHTVYSMLDGHSFPKQYIARAAELGQSAAAITDHGNISGVLDFYDAAIDFNVKPILGEEFYQARKTRFDQDEEERAGKANDDLEQRGPYHLTVLARNPTGYRNLIKLSSRAFLEGYYVKPRIDHGLLAEHSDGLIVLSACLNGEVAQSLLREDFDNALRSAATMQEIVGRDNYYIEIQDHGIDEQRRIKQQLVQIAELINAPIVPTGDCHYTHQHDHIAHDLSLCVATNATVDQEKRFRFFGPEFYLKSYEEMVKDFPAEWLRNTLAVADKIDLKLEFGKLYFPEFPLPSGYTYDSYLEEKVWKGIRVRYGEPSQEVINRTTYELRVIREMGFQSYFLVVADLVEWANKNSIRTGVGRGSAASSIVSYALRITGLDPIRFNLLFERFLVSGRKSMPDIDLDFDDRFRDRVIEYARQKYGVDHLANICTFSRIQARSAIRDATRVLGYEYNVGDKIAKLVPPPVQGFNKSLEESLENPDLKKVYESDPNAKKIIDSAKGLEGLLRQTGIHPAGIVIAQSEITNFLPVMQKGKEAPIVTQWEDERVEQCGKLKIDFLGLRNLGVIDITVRLIAERHGEQIEMDRVPLDDPQTYALLCAGDSAGVFQIEGGGMRQLTIGLKPDRIEDLMAIVALYRPGPLGSKMDKAYIARKHGREPVSYEHPVLRDILKDSYGLMIYQENILAIASELAGFSPGEADDLRKAVGKKQLDKIGLFRNKFVEGCRKTHDVDPRVSNKIYSEIEYFGAYGFNIAHAASYAVTAYWTAWLKVHYPVEYMSALLTSVDDKERIGTYISECRRMGITVHPPSINSSQEEFTVVSDDEVLFGLRSIAGVGEAFSRAILSSRGEPYQNLYDFMRRVDVSVLNKGIIEALAESGALDELVELQAVIPMARDERMEILSVEKGRLGTYVSEHPAFSVWASIDGDITHTTQNLDSLLSGDTVVMGGILEKVERKITKRGDTMYIMRLEDIGGSMEVVAFPKETRRFEDKFIEGSIVIITGRVQAEENEDVAITKIILSEIRIPELPQYQSGPPITLNFTEEPPPGIIEKITKLIERTPGDSPVFLTFKKYGHIVTLRMKKPTSIAVDKELQLLTLEERIGL